MKRATALKRAALIVLLLLVCVGCDQSTKYTAKRFLEGKPALSYMGDCFRLSYTENSGAFLGLGSGMPEKLRFTLLVMLASLFLCGFLLFVLRSKKLGSLALFSSTLIIGGGLSNLIDRIVNKGAVIDFMNVGIGPVRTGIFNVADVAIMAGAILFAGIYLKISHHKADTAGG